MAEASKQPAYQKRNWHFAASDLEPPHHNPDLVVHSDMCNIHGIFLQHFNYCMTGTFCPSAYTDTHAHNTTALD
jgi:hypothetical protein